MKMAGYESTPAEEMKAKNVEQKKPEQPKTVDYVQKLKEEVIKRNGDKKMGNLDIIVFINKKLNSKIVRMPTQEVAQRLLAQLLIK